MLSSVRSAVSRATNSILRRSPGGRIDEELRVHLEMLEDDLVRSGLTPAEAHRRALIAIGGIDQVKEFVHDQQGWPFIDHLLQDARYALRMVRRAPAFTLLAAVTLALAIGSNTAIFGILDAIRFRPLPVAHPEQLVQLITVHERSWQTNIDYDVFARLRGTHRSLAGLCAYLPTEATVGVSQDHTDRTPLQAVSGNYFSVLGFHASSGRVLTDRDDAAGAAPVALVSSHFWSTRLGRDPGVLGKTLVVDRVPFTIVGLMGPDFFGADLASPPEVVIPLARVPDLEGRSVQLMGRVAAAGTIDQVRAELAGLFRGYLAELAPKLTRWSAHDRHDVLSQRLDVLPAANGMGDLRLRLTTPLLVLFSFSALVLLAGGANLSGLLLARSAARTREYSVRLSLGASGWRLVRQLLVETALLAAIGGAAALVVARWTHETVLSLFAPDSAALAIPYRVDFRILVYTVLVTMLAGLLVGLVPAIRAARTDLSPAMRGRPAAGGRRGWPRTLAVVLVGQLAVSIVLIVGAGLSLRTLHNLSTFDPGFARTTGLLVDIDVPDTPLGAGLDEVEARILAEMAALPSVRSAALAGTEVFAGGLWSKTIWVQGRRYAANEDQTCRYNVTSPGFFETVGIPVLLGRDFTDRDRHAAPLVAVVNEKMADKYFPGENPIGRRFGDHGPESTGKYEIVGVVANAKSQSLREQVPPTVYQPLMQAEDTLSRLVLHLRTSGDPAALAPRVRERLHTVDAGLAVAGVNRLSDQIDTTVRRERIMALLGSAFASIALLLACVGVYGAASEEVARRTREIGVRVALGARRGQIAAGTIGRTLVLAMGGLAIGLPAALGAGRLVRSMLFGLEPSDALTLIGASVIVTTIAALGAVLPAVRAASVDAMTVLRHE